MKGCKTESKTLQLGTVANTTLSFYWRFVFKIFRKERIALHAVTRELIHNETLQRRQSVHRHVVNIL